MISVDGRRVLLVSTYWAPEHTGSAPYMTQIGEALADAGAHVEVVTTWPHYPAWRADRSLASLTVQNGVRVHRIPVHVPSRSRLSGRARYEGGFMARALRVARRLPRPDVVVACVPTLGAGLAARLLAQHWDVPLVVVVHDLMSAAAHQSGYAGASRLSDPLTKAEHAVHRAADLLLPCSPAFVPALVEAGADLEDIEVVLPWAKDEAARLDVSDVCERRTELGWDDHTVVLHTGNLGHKQGIDELLPTLEVVGREAPDVLTVLMGDGNQAAELRQRVADMPHVQILPAVGNEDYLATVAAADIALVHERSTMRTMSLPSKLSSYFSAGRPVLAVTNADGATGRVVSDAQAGAVVRHGDAAAFIAAIRRLARTDWGADCGAAGAAYAAGNMDRRACLDAVLVRMANVLSPHVDPREAKV